MNIYEINKKLIGDILPVGATHVDEKRIDNLNSHIYLIEMLLNDLYEVARNKNRVEASMHKMGEIANNELKSILEELKDFLNAQIQKG